VNKDEHVNKKADWECVGTLAVWPFSVAQGLAESSGLAMCHTYTLPSPHAVAMVAVSKGLHAQPNTGLECLSNRCTCPLTRVTTQLPSLPAHLI